MGTNTAELAAMVRSIIERQVTTTAAGKKLTAIDAEAVASLVGNIVGNLVTVVEYEIDNALAATERAA